MQQIKKTGRKLIGFLLSFAMALGMSLTAHAAGTQTFSITLHDVNQISHNVSAGTYSKDTKFVFNGTNNNGSPAETFVAITFKDAKGNGYHPTSISYSSLQDGDYNGDYMRFCTPSGTKSYTFTLNNLPNDVSQWKISGVGTTTYNSGGGVYFDLVAVAEPSVNPTLSNTISNYDGKAHSIGTSGGSGGTVQYATSTDNSNWSDWSTTVPSRTATGTTYVKAKVIGDNFHNDSAETSVYKIVINDPATAPTLKGWLGTYDGSAHSVTATGASGGTVNYRTSTDNSNWGSWSTTVPSRKDAGTTYVQAYTKGDASHSDSAIVNSTISIERKEVGLTWGDTSFTYNGKEQAPTVTATGLIGSDTCTVTVTGRQTNTGSYTATAGSLSNSNYKLPSDKTISFQIGKKEVTITAKDQSVELNKTIMQGADYATLEGVAAGDTFSDVTLTASGTTALTTTGTITPSEAVIRNSSAADVTSNYMITYRKGTLTVTKTKPIYTAPEGIQNVVYDGEERKELPGMERSLTRHPRTVPIPRPFRSEKMPEPTRFGGD